MTKSDARWGILILVLGSFAGAATVAFPLAIVGLVAVAAVFGWLQVCARKPAAAAAGIVFFVVFSSHALALLNAVGAPVPLTRNAILLKDAMALILTIVLILRAATRQRDFRAATRTLAYVLCLGTVLALFTRTGSEFAIQLTSIRGALIPIEAVTIGALLAQDERRNVVRLILPAITLAAIYALAEQFLAPPSYLTNVIRVGAYWADVKDSAIFLDLSTGLPSNFYTAQGIPRLSGTFGDPLSAGMVLAAALCIALVHIETIRAPRTTVALLTIALIATFTRGGWILALIVYAFVVIQRHGLPGLVIRALPVGVALTFTVLFVAPVSNYLAGVATGNDGSTQAHLNAHNNNADSGYHWLGSGWGSGGAAAIASGSLDSVSRESALVALVTQTGVLLGLLMVAFLVSVNRREPNGPIRFGMWLGLLASALVSENLLTFNAGFVPFLAVALISTRAASPQAPDESVDTEHDPDHRKAADAEPLDRAEASSGRRVHHLL